MHQEPRHKTTFILFVVSLLFTHPSFPQNVETIAGKWEGMWAREGYVFTYVMELASEESNKVSGRILWSIEQWPKDVDYYFANKKNSKATEFVKGNYDPQTRELRIEGYDKDDPDIIISLDAYRLYLDATGTQLKGSTRAHSDWSGFLTAYRKHEPETSSSKTASPIEKKLPRVYAVIVGVSDYEIPKLDLQYTDDDAELIYEFLKSPQGGGVPESRITLLTGSRATRANIIKALNTQFKNTFEDDLVIFFIASHGIPSSLGNKLYYLGADADPTNLEGTGIAQNDIQEALLNCRAQKKVWISDACHSGALGLNETAMRGTKATAEANIMNSLLSAIANYDKNLIILTASSAGETSLESSEWGGGHGVFTYYLVQGLKGEADYSNDGIVDTRELFEYVRIKVSIATGKKQYPELKGIYQDRFPLSIVQ